MNNAFFAWDNVDMITLKVTDDNQLTEDGAESVALCYAHCSTGATVKRRMRRGEFADWLLQGSAGWMAVEVSGLASGDAQRRLREKVKQVKRCALPVIRAAIVVHFGFPSIMEETV